MHMFNVALFWSNANTMDIVQMCRPFWDHSNAAAWEMHHSANRQHHKNLPSVYM
jgi:hypothetical protein